MLKCDGRAWLNVTDEGNFEHENESCLVIVQRTDDNEIRVGVSLYESDGEDDATVYLTVSEAGRLAHILGIAVLANEAAAHEAASL